MFLTGWFVVGFLHIFAYFENCRSPRRAKLSPTLGSAESPRKKITMKLLVLSDSHGNVDNMARAVELTQPRHILHLGDCLRDAQALHERFPDLPLDTVPGNCDWGSFDQPERLLEFEGVRVLMMHGHTRDVKFGMASAVMAAREQRAEVLLFGHTHDAMCEYEAGLWVMNPGTIRGGWGGATYGVLYLDREMVTCYTLRAE